MFVAPGRYHYDEQRCGGEMRGKEKQKGLYAVERGETEGGEGWVDGGWTVCYPRARIMSGPGLLPRPMFGSMTLSQVKSMLTSMTHITTKSQRIPGIWAATCGHFSVQGSCCCQVHANLSGLCCHQRTWWHSGLSWGQGPCLGLWTFSNQGLCWHPWLG